MKKIEIGGRAVYVSVYMSEALAHQNARHPSRRVNGKPAWVMLGDINEDGDGEFWVCTPCDANRLNRAGYDYAPR